MVNMRSAALCFMLASACSGSGGFTEGFKIGKKDDKPSEEDSSGKDQLGKESEQDDSSADQPIQITGTYLTCSEVSGDDTEVSIGCRLAGKSDGKTVALGAVANAWEFDYEVAGQIAGDVTMRSGGSGELWQIFYEFRAATAGDMKKLVASTTITLDLDLKPGSGVSKAGPEFSGLIAGFIPVGQSETVSGTQDQLDETVVTSTQPESSSEPTTTQTAAGPAPIPVSGPSPGQDQPNPVTGSVTPGAGPSPDGGAAGPGGNDPAVNPANVASADPVVTFSTVYKAGGAMALMASFDQDGLTDAEFSGGGPVEATNIKVNGDGSATYRLSAPVSVIVKKGQKTCTVSGAIITGNMSLPLVCK